MDMLNLLSDAPAGEVTATGGRMQIVFRRHYKKPIAKVWAALTVPERIKDWFGDAEIDLKPGGTLKLMFDNGASMSLPITQVEPPHLFCWSWRIGDFDTTVLFELEEQDGGTQLTLTHSGLSPRKGPTGGVRAGWHAHLEGLADSLDGRATPWSLKEQRQDQAAAFYPPLPA